MLELRDIAKSYNRRQILDRVGLTLADGEVVALVGPSGSGKSTLLRIIAGMVTPDSGDVIVDGTIITSWPTHRRNIGFVFQDEQLFPHRNVGENVEYGLRMAGWPRTRRRGESRNCLISSGWRVSNNDR